jgi:hypothetical protein
MVIGAVAVIDVYELSPLYAAVTEYEPTVAANMLHV